MITYEIQLRDGPHSQGEAGTLAEARAIVESACIPTESNPYPHNWAQVLWNDTISRYLTNPKSGPRWIHFKKRGEEWHFTERGGREWGGA